MYAVLKDEQSLSENVNGLNLKITSKETFQCEGFHYDVFYLDHPELCIVLKVLSSGDYDTYVCFRVPEFTPGSREENSWLFGDDGLYISSIFNNENEYAGIHSVACEVQTSEYTKPGFVTEYETNVKVENPRVFVLETVDERDGDSYIDLVQGCRVNNSDVEILGV